MRRFKFYYSPEIPQVKPTEEIVEFDDDISDEDIQECFEDWVFNQIDTACIEIDLE